MKQKLNLNEMDENYYYYHYYYYFYFVLTLFTNLFNNNWSISIYIFLPNNYVYIISIFGQIH
jgi:hypothetical protein